MSEQDKIQLFENQPIRAAWIQSRKNGIFSIVDVIRYYGQSLIPQTYWRVMKKTLER